MAYERQFQISNPGLPRRADDASMRQSTGQRPGPSFTGVAGKVLTPVAVATGGASTMAGLGATTRPPNCALSSDCGARMLGMSGRSTGNGMGQGKSWRF